MRIYKTLLAVFGLTTLVLAGCDFGKNLHPVEELARTGAATEYRIGAGDTIMIDVWGEPRLSGQQYIREDGSFTMPLVGDIVAGEKTPKELGAHIGQQLMTTVHGATVAVSVVKSAPIRYYLLGSFLTPGEYTNDGRITLVQAIAAGGGFAPFADESEIILIRKTREGDARYKLNYNKVIDGRQPNPELRSGDVISVR